MPAAESMLDRSPDVVTVEAVTTPVESDVLVVGLRGSAEAPSVVAEALDEKLRERLTAALRTVGAPTGVGTTARIPAPEGTPGTSVLSVGLGDATDGGPEGSLDDETLRRAAGSAARACRGLGSTLLVLDPSRPEEVALGAGLGSYVPSKVTSRGDTEDESGPGSDVLRVLSSDSAWTADRANAVARRVGLARDLVGTPPNLLYPETFADRAAGLGREAGLEIEVLDESALRDGGYGGLLGVGGGSSRPPRLLRMTHRAPGSGPRRTVALVGKGVTFDTGGISLKPAAGMEKMTSDMGGAAAVVATVLLAADLGLDIDVVATVPMAENMPSSTAYRPGDVLTIRGGTTVEVQNTDAEGRLILADAIVRACEDDPDHLIDTATLTGAQMVALGTRTPGVMGHDEFRDRVAELSRTVGENGWPMPLPEEIRDELDSEVADLSNVTPTRWGGMLAAGLFLAEFVREGVTWAHIDVAGPAYNDGAPTGYLPKGGTGVPVRTMLAVLEDLAGTSA